MSAKYFKMKKSFFEEVIICALFILVASVFEKSYSTYLAYITMLALIIIITARSKCQKEIEFIMLAGIISMYIVPYLGFIIFNIDISIIFFYLYMLPYVFIRNIISFENRFEPVLKYYRHPAIVIFPLISFVGLFVWAPIFYGFYALSIYMLERLSSGNLRNSRVYIYASLIYFVVFFNIIYIWSGGGRIFQLTLLIIPLLILVKYNYISITKWLLFLVMPIGVIIGEIIRGATEILTVGVSQGSAGHHLIIMNDIFKSKSIENLRFGDLFGQFVLMILNWFPRELWSQKPVGIGLWFVDKVIGRNGFGEEHNVSLGFFGEHMFLAPGLWVFTSAITLIFAAAIGKKLFIMTNNSYSVLYIYCANFLTLLWGGMAAFGARVWWFIIPLILYIYIEKVLARNKRMKPMSLHSGSINYP